MFSNQSLSTTGAVASGAAKDEKVKALAAAWILKDLLPRRLYQAVGASVRSFPHNLPLAPPRT